MIFGSHAYIKPFLGTGGRNGLTVPGERELAHCHRIAELVSNRPLASSTDSVLTRTSRQASAA